MRRAWIIWYAIAVHATWGAVLLLSNDAGKELNLDWMVGVFSETGAGLVFVLVALAAAFGVWHHHASPLRRYLCLVALIPQQAILVVNSLILTSWVVKGAVPFGIDIPPALLVVPSASVWWATIFHTVAIWDYHGQELWNRQHS